MFLINNPGTCEIYFAWVIARMYASGKEWILVK